MVRVVAVVRTSWQVGPGFDSQVGKASLGGVSMFSHVVCEGFLHVPGPLVPPTIIKNIDLVNIWSVPLTKWTDEVSDEVH